jgi:predicted Zn finger-like uncharacterized protein
MFVHCPICGTQHVLEDKVFGDSTRLKVRCNKCGIPFAAKPSELTARADNVTVMGGTSKLPSGKRVSLVVIQGPMQGSIFRVMKPELTIGRSGTDVIIDDPEVSGKHCMLEVHGTYGVLTDMESTNGTFVDEQPIKRQRLEHLGEFRLGTTTIMFAVAEEDTSGVTTA